jgi:hypothetical protein
LLVTVLCLPSAFAKDVAGVALPDSISAGGTTLALNGAGVRKKFFIDLYVGALYLARPGANAQAVVAADEPMAITLHIISDKITSERMVEATEEGFANATGGNTAPLQSSIDAFMAFFQEPIKDGDVFEIAYEPAGGQIQVAKNGAHKGNVDGGLEFKRAVFAIWLGKKPVQESMKKGMLGG